MDWQVTGEVLQEFFSANSFGVILLRALLWFVVALVIIASTDASADPKNMKNLKSNLGYLMLFIVLCGGLMYMLFGFVPLI